jgi:hypothetical protein
MRAAHLEFTGAVIRQRTFDDVRVRVLTNEERTCAYIVFDEPVPEATWVALTTHCLALVAHDRLKGFWVDIEA